MQESESGYGALAGKIRDWKTVSARTAPQRNYGRMNLAAGSPLLDMGAGRADTGLE